MVEQVVGDLAEDVVGVELEADLRAVPARVANPTSPGHARGYREGYRLDRLRSVGSTDRGQLPAAPPGPLGLRTGPGRPHRAARRGAGRGPARWRCPRWRPPRPARRRPTTGPDTRPQHPFGDGGGLALAVQVAAHDGELVAAEAGDGVAGPDHRGDALGHLGEDEVAGAVAVAVVDRLEAVEVDVEHGHQRSRPARGPGCRAPPRTRCGWTDPVSGSRRAAWTQAGHLVAPAQDDGQGPGHGVDGVARARRGRARPRGPTPG